MVDYYIYFMYNIFNYHYFEAIHKLVSLLIIDFIIIRLFSFPII
jgi:hypothetical protein